MYAGVYVGSTFLGGFLAGLFHKIFHERAMVAAENAKDTEYNKMVSGNWASKYTFIEVFFQANDFKPT